MDYCGAIIYPEFFPELVLDNIFSHLELPDLLSCMLVCRNWNQAINGDSTEPWKSMCRFQTSDKFLNSEHLSSMSSYKDKLRAILNSWNPKDCSPNIAVENYGFTFLRNLVADSTDMVRTKTGYNTGKHIWEITWNQPLGKKIFDF